MKVLIARWNGYGYDDIIKVYQSLGYQLCEFNYTNKIDRRDEKIEAELTALISEFMPDYIFSFNFYPFIAVVAKNTDTKYVSWIYDSPYVMMYSYTIGYPTNYVFVFDKAQYAEFRNGGINTVYYLPLAANAKRLNSYTDRDYFMKTPWFNKTSIAFVGSLYTEHHQFYKRLEHISRYTRGYLEGLIAVQRKVYGYNFIQEVLSTELMDDMHDDLPMEISEDGIESLEYLYAQYVINRHISSLERTDFLKKIGEKYKYDLYTNDKNIVLPNCINHGRIDFFDGAPHVYHEAKINLNFTLRSITTGVPLRAFEVTGSEGFLLTNYQPDYDDVFVANEEYVYFEDEDDMMGKLEYYLSHERERKEIAHNGYLRTLNDHSFEKRIEEIEAITFEQE